jgi:hypothetical protein
MPYRVENLSKLSFAETRKAFATISQFETTLDLSSSFLSTFHFIALDAIPLSVTSIDLSNNCFGGVLDEALAIAFAAIPPSVKTLILQNNSFDKKSPEQLRHFFSSVPLTVKIYDLRGNNLNAEQLDAIISKSIAWGVETIILDDRVIDGTKWFLKKLVDSVYEEVLKLSHFKKKNLEFNQIEFSVDIDGDRLNRWIERLEMQQHPLADFSCGLLLANHIYTTTDILKNCKAYDEYWEKRCHDAISFYLKAAKEPMLRPILIAFLWNIKFNCSYPSVYQRLDKLDLIPLKSTASLANHGLFKSSEKSLLNAEHPDIAAKI